MKPFAYQPSPAAISFKHKGVRCALDMVRINDHLCFGLIEMRKDGDAQFMGKSADDAGMPMWAMTLEGGDETVVDDATGRQSVGRAVPVINSLKGEGLIRDFKEVANKILADRFPAAATDTAAENPKPKEKEKSPPFTVEAWAIEWLCDQISVYFKAPIKGVFQ